MKLALLALHFWLFIATASSARMTIAKVLSSSISGRNDHDACSQKTEYGQPVGPIKRARYHKAPKKPLTGKHVWEAAQRLWTDSCFRSNRCEWYPFHGFSDADEYAINGVCIPSSCFGLINKEVCENWSETKPWGYERDEKLWEVEDLSGRYRTFPDFVADLPPNLHKGLLEKRCVWTATDWNPEAACVKAADIMPGTSICLDISGPFQKRKGGYHPIQTAESYDLGLMLENMPMPCETEEEKLQFTDAQQNCKKGDSDISILQLAGFASKAHTTLRRFHIALHIRPKSKKQQKLLLGRQVDVYLDPSVGKYLEMTRMLPLLLRDTNNLVAEIPADANEQERGDFHAAVQNMENDRDAHASVKIEGWLNMKMVMVRAGQSSQTWFESFVSNHSQKVVGAIMRKKLANKLSTAFLKLVDHLGGSLGDIITWIGDIQDFGSFEFSVNAKCLTIGNFRSQDGSSTGGSLQNFRRIFNVGDSLAKWWAWALQSFGSTVAAYYYAMAELLHELGLKVIDSDGVASLHLTLPPREEIAQLKAKAAARKVEAQQRAEQWLKRKEAARNLLEQSRQSVLNVTKAATNVTIGAAASIQNVVKEAWENVKTFWFGAPESEEILEKLQVEIEALDKVVGKTDEYLSPELESPKPEPEKPDPKPTKFTEWDVWSCISHLCWSDRSRA